jgi:hypothetical protein
MGNNAGKAVAPLAIGFAAVLISKALGLSDLLALLIGAAALVVVAAYTLR